MFYGATPVTFEKAKSLRRRMTPSEKHVWELLKDGNFVGYKFRRQHPMGIYIADFYCHKLGSLLS
jgi:very-short-patch-repair endonuclease